MRTHLVSIEELNCSVNANPRFRLHTTDGVFTTSSDTPASYEARNALGKDVTLRFTRAGRVTHIDIERHLEEELSVCVVCAHLIANGEFDDGTGDAELAISRTLLRHPEGYTGMSVNEETGFSTSPCDACGDALHGDRFSVTRLTPQ